VAGRRKIVNPLALAVLGLLQEQPRHPYEMAGILRERHKDGSFKINSGSLYDTVAALVKHGWIAPAGTERDGRRPERTVYAHTELGQREFVGWLDELLREPANEYPKFLAAVSYLGALGPDRARAALTERARRLDDRLGELDAVLAETVGNGRAPRLFMIEVECARHLCAAELDWTRRTAAEIQTGELAWPVIHPTDATGNTGDGWTWENPA
jgi:DNA-binding PadR family transcriptional regulator